MPHAGHTQGLATAPRAWETHVISFLNAALHPNATAAGKEPGNSGWPGSRRRRAAAGKGRPSLRPCQQSSARPIYRRVRARREANGMSAECAAGHLIELAALAALLAAPLGTVPGILAALGVLTTVSVTYFSVLRPRLVRWGATDEEVAWPMPGDDIAAPGGQVRHPSRHHRRARQPGLAVDGPARLRASWLVQRPRVRCRPAVQRRADPARVAAARPRRSHPHHAGFRLGRHRCRRRPLLRRAHPRRGDVMVPGGRAGR